MILQHYMRYPGAYMTVNTDLPTHNLIDNNPTHPSGNLLIPLQLPMNPYSTPNSNVFPTIAFPTSTILNPTHLQPPLDSSDNPDNNLPPALPQPLTEEQLSVRARERW
jgi:hypothetical protein